MGRLMYELNPFEISGRRVGQVFGGQPVPGPFPFKTFGSVWPAMGLGLGPRYPQCPPFPTAEVNRPRLGKKSKVDRRIIGNSLLLMSLNFLREFYNFYAIALNVIGPPRSILRYMNSYKRR